MLLNIILLIILMIIDDIWFQFIFKLLSYVIKKKMNLIINKPRALSKVSKDHSIYKSVGSKSLRIQLLNFCIQAKLLSIKIYFCHTLNILCLIIHLTMIIICNKIYKSSHQEQIACF